MGEVTSFKARRGGVGFEPPPSTAERLRANIQRRDQLAADLRLVDLEIAADARCYADEQGEYIRPSLDQLRKRLIGGIL